MAGTGRPPTGGGRPPSGTGGGKPTQGSRVQSLDRHLADMGRPLTADEIALLHRNGTAHVDFDSARALRKNELFLRATMTLLQTNPHLKFRAARAILSNGEMMAAVAWFESTDNQPHVMLIQPADGPLQRVNLSDLPPKEETIELALLSVVDAIDLLNQWKQRDTRFGPDRTSDRFRKPNYAFGSETMSIADFRGMVVEENMKAAIELQATDSVRRALQEKGILPNTLRETSTTAIPLTPKDIVNLPNSSRNAFSHQHLPMEQVPAAAEKQIRWEKKKSYPDGNFFLRDSFITVAAKENSPGTIELELYSLGRFSGKTITLRGTFKSSGDGTAPLTTKEQLAAIAIYAADHIWWPDRYGNDALALATMQNHTADELLGQFYEKSKTKNIQQIMPVGFLKDATTQRKVEQLLYEGMALISLARESKYVFNESEYTMQVYDSPAKKEEVGLVVVTRNNGYFDYIPVDRKQKRITLRLNGVQTQGTAGYLAHAIDTLYKLGETPPSIPKGTPVVDAILIYHEAVENAKKAHAKKRSDRSPNQHDTHFAALTNDITPLPAAAQQGRNVSHAEITARATPANPSIPHPITNAFV